jgi:HlyD family secretion protein/hemolysin D
LAQKSSATENLAKAKRRFDLATIRAPLGGVITQLNIRTVGGVVSSAQQLVSITPNGSPLEVEVVLPNREAGFVREGQEVQVKVDAYPFTRYGLLKGEVISVAQDAEPQSNPNEYITMGSQRKADQSANIEGSERLLYTVRVRIDPDSLLLDGRPVSLIPGMAVRAEIKTGSRTILEFLMAPLAEYMQQSMRER